MSNRIRAGFTLLELMISIGILVLLMAILLPVAGRAREHSHMAICANNMRQMLLAVQLYTRDNNDRYPIPGGAGPQYAFSVPSLGQLDYTVGCLWHYIGRDFNTRYQILNCPSDLEAARAVRKGSMMVLPRNFSYSFNAQLQGGLRLASIINPSMKIILVEEVWPNDSCAFIANNPVDLDDQPTNRHDGRSNEGFADGHVDSFYPVDLGFNNDYSGVADPNTQQTYCNLLVQ